MKPSEADSALPSRPDNHGADTSCDRTVAREALPDHSGLQTGGPTAWLRRVTKLLSGYITTGVMD